MGGVLLGTAALAVGAGPSTQLNTIYHSVISWRSSRGWTIGGRDADNEQKPENDGARIRQTNRVEEIDRE